MTRKQSTSEGGIVAGGSRESRQSEVALDAQLLLRRSWACKCSHGPHKHEHGRGRCDQGCACTLFDPSLRADPRYPELTKFWTRVGTMRLSEFAAGDLISGAEDYVLDRATTEQVRKIHKLAINLQGTLDEVLGSPTLRARIALPHGPQLASIRECLKWLIAEMENPPAGVSSPEVEMPEGFRQKSQFELQVVFRTRALERMEGAAGKRRSSYTLIASAIDLTSGGTLKPDGTTIRLEYLELSPRQRGAPRRSETERIFDCWVSLNRPSVYKNTLAANFFGKTFIAASSIDKRKMIDRCRRAVQRCLAQRPTELALS